MLTRRFLVATAVPAALPALLPSTGLAAQRQSFEQFIENVEAEARREGIRPMTLRHAFAGVTVNEKVLERDRHQPEFTMTWAHYRRLIVTPKRITAGRQAVAEHRALFRRVQQHYGVAAGAIAGIWGIESSFGAGTGGFRVVEALATLAWNGRRASFFRHELLAALKILDHGDISPERMTGSYAGAMGQPQFMPTSYLRYAVDFTGSGRRNIWTNVPDVLASIANYLAKSGWRNEQTWGQAVLVPSGLRAPGRDTKRPLAAWIRDGVRPSSGRWYEAGATPAALVAPDGAGGDTFLVYPNFMAIRRYNPSDFYALAVGLIGDQVIA